MPSKIDLVIYGSIGLDDVKTPFGKVQSALGGSASYSSIAASYFTKAGILAVIGADFPKEFADVFIKKHIDLTGLTIEGKTFRWEGLYEFDMNEAKTMRVELNALANYRPEVPKEYLDAKYLFLANGDPGSQIEVAEQFKKAFIVIDTMNFWIDTKKDTVLNALKYADLVVLNDAEARQLCQETNLVKAAKTILKNGTKYVIIKKGEHGALFFSKNSCFNAPAYPLEDLKDPTGAGDTFAGALIGYLAHIGKTDEKTIRKAVIYGSALASFTAEDFSIRRLVNLTKQQIEKRYDEFKEIRKF
jgi:ribokinase